MSVFVRLLNADGLPGPERPHEDKDKDQPYAYRLLPSGALEVCRKTPAHWERTIVYGPAAWASVEGDIVGDA